MRLLKTTILTIITLFLCINSVSANTFVPDSIGTEVIDGKAVILHRVEPKETLYSIHNKYGVSVSEITTMNPGAEMGLRIGQILKIPTSKVVKSTSTETVEEVLASTGTEETTEKKITYHTVKPGETLYGISTMYPCSVDEIKKWNALTSNALSVGQLLQVSEGGFVTTEKKEETTSTTSMIITPEEPTETITETVEETTTTEEVIETTTKEIEKIEEVEETVNETTTEEIEEPVTKEETTETTTTEITTEELIITHPQTEIVNDDSLPITRTADMGGYTKNFEKGYAELLPETQNDERYLAHHRTLPEGTILQVKNLANGKSVFVRVVGTFESDDKTLIIKLSSKSEVRLGAKDTPRFLTEISYIP